ncbi:type IV secretion system protein [Erythrobacter sp.]|uniref:type IV secretion system protein n=1 Tax=Erythrobacter sp. TaxID=1042 RepID=UPI001B178396|nr:type IV secretion system protein [Erythrobacter sp.]MBO6528249.1 type IV secretion system protein [Erythrobacter sp.]MBO6530011.1 type IV secretion system protein [Erythrobacter sp.]
MLTIFVALIGYRLILNREIDLSHGVSWAVRVGIVLALLTGWTAFQTLFYDVTIAWPSELASGIGESSGIVEDPAGARAQRAYDSLRVGLEGYQATRDEGGNYYAQKPLPTTATLFFVSAVGLEGAVRLAAAFLLAIAPFPIMALLAGPGAGLFVGWIRALLTTVFATTGLAMASSLSLLAVEAEISRMQALGLASWRAMDEQAPLAIVVTFLLVGALILIVSSKLASGITVYVWQLPAAAGSSGTSAKRPGERVSPAVANDNSAGQRSGAGGGSARPVAVSEAFERTIRRENEAFGGGRPIGPFTASAGGSGHETDRTMRASSFSRSRTPLGRRHRSTLKRDGKA